MTSPGARYSAGTAILDVVPVFKDVQKAIAKEAREIERALGKEVGDEFGKQVEKSVVSAVDKALGTTKAQAKKSGADAAEAYSGQFATRFSDTMRRMQREMSSLKFDAQFDDKKLQNKFNALRRDIDDLNKRKIGIDMDAGPAMIEIDRIDAKMRELRDKSIDLNVRTSLGAATAAVEAFRKQIQRDAEIEVEVELKTERSLGLFEKTVRRRIESALSNFPPIEFDADVTEAQEKLMVIRERLIALGDKQIGVDIKADKALRDVEALRRELAMIANDESATVQVRADAAGAAKDLLGILAISKLVDDTDVDIEVKVDGDKKAQTGLMGLRNRLLGAGQAGEEGAAGMRSFNIAILGGAALLPGLVPLLTAAAGGLALLGPLALGAGAGLAVMGIAFSGVGDAVDALGKVQDNAAKDAEAAAKRIRSAGRTVEDAERSLSRARENAGRTATDAARRVADAVESQQDAEEDLVRAQRDVVRAQEQVTRAREQAQDRIEDLRLAIVGGALAEREAILDLAEAQREYDAAMADPDATAEERERLLIDLEQQRLQVERLGIENGRLAEEQAEVARTGVEGSREVVSAQEGVQRAQEGVESAMERVADAQQAVTDAILDQQQSNADAAQAIEDAQRNLIQAQEDYTTAVGETSASVDALEVAMGKLGPAGQEFARFWFALLPQFREMRDLVQAGMFPGLQEAITDILEVNGPMLRDFMGTMGTVLGNLFREFGDMMTSPQWMGIWRTFSEYAPIFMQQFGDVALAMLTFFGELFEGLAPYSERFGAALVVLAEKSAEWMAAFTESQTFRDIMEWLFTNGPTIFQDLFDIVEAIGSIIVALEPLGMLILGMLDNVADFINEMDPALLGGIVTAILGLVVAFQLASLAAAILYSAALILAAPIAGIVFIAAAVVTALIVLYTQSETFRDIVDSVMRVVGAVIEWLWNDVIQPVFRWIGEAFFATVDWISDVWNDTLMPVFRAIGDILSTVWETKIWPILEFFGVVFGTLVDLISRLWNDILMPVFRLIGSVLQEVWEIVRPIFELMGMAFEALVGLFLWAWENIGAPVFGVIMDVVTILWKEVFDPAMNGIMNIFEGLMIVLDTLWRTIGKPVFDLIQAVVESLVAIFSGNFDELGKIWSSFWNSLKDAASTPVNFVIHYVLNEGLFKAFDWVIETLKLPADWKIGDIDQVGNSHTHFAAGGEVPGYSPHDKADNIPAMLTAGEWVQPVSTVNYYGAEVMEAIRKKRIPREAFQYLAEGGPVYRQLFNAVKSKFPRAKLNSGFRAGDPGLHGAGLAVDLGEEGFAGGRGRPYLANMANTLYRTAKPFIAELIYTGAGDATPDIKNGRNLDYGRSTNAQHENHVHLAVRNVAAFLKAFTGGEGNFFTGAWDWITGKVGGLWDSVTGVFNSIKDSVTGPVADFFGKFGDSPMTKIIGAMPGKAVDWAWGKIKGAVGDFFDMLDQSNGGDNAAVDAVVDNGQVKGVVQSVAARYGWDRGAEWNALDRLIQKESGWNPKAQNPTSTAYGLFQFLNGTWGSYGEKTADPAGQAQAGMKYIMDRYGSPTKALAFHNKNNWYSEGGEVAPAVARGDDAPTLYDTGGWLPPGISTVLNATNRPEPILTGQQWEELTSGISSTVDGERHGIRHLHLHEVQADLSEAIGSVNHWVRVYDNGGKYIGGGVQ